MRSSSWYNPRPANAKRAPVRAMASAYADKYYKSNTREWEVAYESFLSGYLKSQRARFAEIRLKVETQHGPEKK